MPDITEIHVSYFVIGLSVTVVSYLLGLGGSLLRRIV